MLEGIIRLAEVIGFIAVLLWGTGILVMIGYIFVRCWQWLRSLRARG